MEDTNTQMNDAKMNDSQMDGSQINDSMMMFHTKHFMASTFAMIELLKLSCERKNDNELSVKEQRGKKRFLDSCDVLLKQFKESTNDFDFTRFIKKAFNTFKQKEHCEYILNNDPKIFEIRDRDGKIMTIIPGMDLGIGYKWFDDKEKTNFWQIMNLFAESVFSIIMMTNQKIVTLQKYEHIVSANFALKHKLATTGVYINSFLYNPYNLSDIGSGDSFSVNSLYNGVELPSEGADITVQSLLSLLGLDKMINVDKIREELDGFTDEHAEKATDQILSLLNAENNPEVREICSDLIKDIVSNIKENGMEDIGASLMRVAQGARNKYDEDKMRKTAEKMQTFMDHGHEVLENMDKSGGGGIPKNLLSTVLSMTRNMGQPRVTREGQPKVTHQN